MKAIILPCTPAECEKIVNGDISILVRKVAPKETPFKVYVYCGKTHSENVLLIDKETKEAYFGDYRNGCCCDIDGYVDCFIADDNVIGDFICNTVDEYAYDYCDGVDIDDDTILETAIEREDINIYAKGKTLRGLRISDLKIYDEPKELSEFKKADCACPFPYVYLPPCPNCDERDINSPPKNYIYVEE